jgi:hypothetical protein
VAEIGSKPEEPADDREARLHNVALPIGSFPLGEQGAIVELEGVLVTQRC